MVQDPNFWRRFSVAVHNDEAAILAADLEKGQKGKRETKHAYVVSLTSPIDSPTSITTPTSQHHLSPAFPPAVFSSPRPLSAPAPTLALEQSAARRKEERKSAATSGTGRSIYFDATEKTPEMIALYNLPSLPNNSTPTLTSSGPLTPKSAHFPSNRASTRFSRLRHALSSHPPSLPPTPSSPSFPPFSHSTSPNRTSRFTTRNPSRLSLGISLSGRPKGAFKFWTTIEADARNSDSWLERQQKKARQRTWMCWAFWMAFLVVVVGGIVAVLVLKGKGII